MKEHIKRIKKGRLYNYPLECPDIDKFFFVRLFRRLGITYIPVTLRFYDELYLREDMTKLSRKLVEHCRHHGIRTYVVQEGAYPIIYTSNWVGHFALFADYFLCPKGQFNQWIKAGMPKRRIVTFTPQKETQDYKGVIFLVPLLTWEDNKYRIQQERNSLVFKVIEEYIKKDVVFKLHNYRKEILLPFIPPHRIVEGNAKDLIRKYDKIYCFSFSSIVKDCEMVGKKYKAVDV